MSSELALNIQGAHGGRWKRYTAYRDSGVEWLGEVPDEWEVIGLRRLLDSVNGIKIGPFGSQLKSDIIQPTGFKVYGQENVIARNFDLGYRFVDEDKFKELAVCEIISGDIVVTMMGTTGRCQVVPENIQKGIMDSYLLRIRINEMTINPFFLEIIIDEALYIKHQIKVAGKGSIMHGLNSSIIKSLSIALPSLPEQRSIAAFLARETRRIDTLIEKKGRQIELLQEKRVALISHAVTKGLDPDVKMKDSRVEWLEEVPEHWDETITSALFMDNKKKNKGTKEINLLSLSYGNIIRKDINTNEGLLPETFEAYQIVYPGYIVLRLTDLQNDKRSLRVGHANEKGIITSAYTGLIKKSDAVECSKYFYYLLHTYDIIKVFYGMGAGVRQSLNFNELRKLRLLLPPPEEQKAIAAFIDRETRRIDTLTTKIRESISKLSEYRTTLISDAVTGKIDVRQETA